MPVCVCVSVCVCVCISDGILGCSSLGYGMCACQSVLARECLVMPRRARAAWPCGVREVGLCRVHLVRAKRKLHVYTV